VHDDQLSVRERATLLVLMAEARELSNAELRAVARTALDGAARRRLNQRRLVVSRRVGRAFVHELTDDGWAWCAAELSAGRPDRAGYAGGALYALLAGLNRHLERDDRKLSDIFRPHVEAQVREAYRTLAREPGGWVGLAALRARLEGVARDEVDAALRRMAGRPGVHVQPESNQQALTGADRAAAVRFGGEDRHLLMIEAA
jgi:hypothetical protein